MKIGLRIGGLVLALLAPGAGLFAEDAPWQAAEVPSATSAPVAVLQAPVALPVRPLTVMAPPSPPPGDIVPVGFEAPAPISEPPPGRAEPTAAVPAPAIIAVSAPVAQEAPPVATANAEESTDTLFASDRPLGVGGVGRAAGGSIVRTSASTTVPAGPEVPMVPGWDAPLDASWGRGPQMPGPAPDGTDLFSPAGFNPLKARFYLDGEYLLWWVQGDRVPVLATTSNASDFGILGAPSTQVLFGGNAINTGPFSGFRFAAGYWLGCEQDKAVEFNGFFLGPRAANFTAQPSQFPVIGRPFLEANTVQESAQLTSLPNVTAGSLNIHSPTFLWGLGTNLRCVLCCGCNYRISALAGFRNLNLDENLTITENIQGLPTAPAPFTNQMITVTDSFSTHNHFYGGQVGVDGRWYHGKWSVDGRATVALGDTVQYLDINGSQRFVSPTGTVQNFTGGLLALPSNIGHHGNNAFSVVPEIGVNLGYQILPRLRGSIGYNFLYWSNVIRPGPSIDRSLDVTQIPNFPVSPTPPPAPGHPAATFHEVGFWAQGLTFGLEFVY